MESTLSSTTRSDMQRFLNNQTFRVQELQSRPTKED